MDSNTRACIAYIVGRLINGGSPTAVYDYAESRSISISGEVSGANVDIYDHDQLRMISGTIPTLYDHGRQAPISLSIEGTKFHGTVYADDHGYVGSVSGRIVAIYDLGASANFQYEV